MERRLSAILAADVVGFSRLMGKDEEGTLERLKELRKALVQPRITERKGRIVKLMGDGVLAEFPSVVEAVQCALEIQQAMAAREPDLPDGQRIVLRVGVNLGDVIVEGTDIYGDGVNVAARLEALAEPGGVCVSGAAFDAVEGKLDIVADDMGPQRVKNIAKPVRAYRLVVAQGEREAPGRRQRDTVAPEKPSIAVLPFDNMSGDPEQEYFSDGITEDIITELARFNSLFVVARNSSFHYKGQSPKIQEIARELGVQHVVEGSVRKAGNRVRITAQLIAAETGAHIWAERYDRELNDIFAVQDEVVAAVVAKLGISLNDMMTARAKSRPTEFMTAYDHLLRARSAWLQGSINEAFGFAQKAVDTDPSYAAAQAYLSLQYAYQFFGGTMGLTPQTIAEKSRQHAEAALRLDDTDPFVHAAVSMAFGFSPEPAKERGLKHINTAVTLNPHDCELMLLQAYHLSFFGRQNEALDLLDKFCALNPLGDFMASECYADTYYMLGEYDKALERYKDQADAPPQVVAVFAACHAQCGRVDDATACLSNLENMEPDGFDVRAFADAQLTVCARDEDRERWRNGFNLAGIDI